MNRYWVSVGENGHWEFPEDLQRLYGLKPGAKVCIDETAKGLRLRLPITHLKKVYIEPTNRCNLDCRTCMRRTWDEPPGQMSGETFLQIINGLHEFSPPPAIFFGALGEPLAHPNISEMVARAKSMDSYVEMITNGTLLTRDLSQRLIEAGLDKLWISLDGATSESYEDVRLGAELPKVLNNIIEFRNMRLAHLPPASFSGFKIKPEIAISFVAMKKNIHELPSLLSLAGTLGASHILVSNVLPYSEEMGREVLYSHSLTDMAYKSSAFRLDLPKINIDDETKKPLYLSMRTRHSINLAGSSFSEGNDYCPFIEKGAMVISWEGNVSPCIPLMHTHKSYFDGIERFCRRFTIGNVNEDSLKALWEKPEYVSFRERVQLFDFPACTHCGGCSLLGDNEEDCVGNSFPTCGGCLWAQGVIQCP